MKVLIKIFTVFLLLQVFSLEAVAQGFKLPWDNGVSYYVSRTGTPAPTGPTASTCHSSLYGYTPHNYVAIDFDSPNGVYDPVRAAKAGTVIFAGWSGTQTTGYGRLVKIKHDDNTQTYYAHNNEIFVTVGQYVEQGCIIADGGTTGNSTGDHIHFEWRDVGGAAFSDHRYPTFTECGCKVKPDYCYTSSNTNGSCSGTPCTPPTNDDCSDATTITSNGTSVTGTVKCATTSFGANQCSGCNCSSPDDLDVYFKFVAQKTSHKVTLFDYASDFDGVIELRSGCGFGTNIGCYDSSGVPSSVVKTFNGLTVGETYYVRIYEWDNIGTPPSSPTFKVKVEHECDLPANIPSISGSSSLCSGDSQTFSVSPVTGATSYTWTLPSGWTGTSTTSSITATVGSSGGQVKVKANNDCGSSDSQTLQVNVSDPPEMPSPIGGEEYPCKLSSQTYSIFPVAGATGYTWTLPSGWIGSSTTTTLTAIVGSNDGTITVKANKSCGSGPERTFQVNVKSIDNSVTVDNSKMTSNEVGADYQWIDCSTMNSLTGETGQTFTATENGSYAVIINKDNCVDTSACHQVSMLGVSYNDHSIHLKAYPNPTKDKILLSINGLTNEKHRVIFRNTQGKILIDEEFKVYNQTLETQFDIKNFPAGLYFMTIRSENLNRVFKIEKL